jgi:hypothetical protein
MRGNLDFFLQRQSQESAHENKDEQDNKDQEDQPQGASDELTEDFA